MRFKLFEKSSVKKERLALWHDWFAWYPVKITNGELAFDDSNRYAWLEIVSRRIITLGTERTLPQTYYNYSYK